MEPVTATEGVQEQEGTAATEWLTVKAAAARLGISEKGVRARIRRGTVVPRQVPTKHGDQWLVAFENGQPVEPPTVGDTEPSTVDASGPPTAQKGVSDIEGLQAEGNGVTPSWDREREQLLERIKDKDAENGHLREQLALRAHEVERFQVIMLENARRLAALEEENRHLLALPSLVNPRQEDGSDGAEETQEEETVIASEEPQPPPRRSWWQRLFGG